MQNILRKIFLYGSTLPDIFQKINRRDTLSSNEDFKDSKDAEEFQGIFTNDKKFRQDLFEPLLDNNCDNTSSSIHRLPIINRMVMMKDSNTSNDSHSYNVMDKYESWYQSKDQSKYIRDSRHQG